LLPRIGCNLGASVVSRAPARAHAGSRAALGNIMGLAACHVGIGCGLWRLCGITRAPARPRFNIA
jgi:hypothetical protein